MKRRYKVLPLSTPFTCQKEWWEGCVQELHRMTPVFNRNGYYYDRKEDVAWLEINGEAWRYYNWDKFKFELELLEPRLHPSIRTAMVVLRSARMLTKQQLHRLYMDECAERIQATYNDSRLFTRKALRRSRTKRGRK